MHGLEDLTILILKISKEGNKEATTKGNAGIDKSTKTVVSQSWLYSEKYSTFPDLRFDTENTKMKIQIFLATLCLVVVSARHGGGGHHGPPISTELRECIRVLFMSGGEDMEGIINTCIVDNGLDVILANITESHDDDEDEDGPSRPGRHHKRNVDAILEANGYMAEALMLRKCISGALGFVTEEGTFDTEKFKDSFSEKVAGTPQEENVELGLENCPTDGFAEFRVSFLDAARKTGSDKLH
ncbi:hypothetical protein FHG87_021247 [Trinorchestia longiramus]|nr:hypothetical protein FHG87_021247 [Trinorchestia longiramus]